MVSAVVLVEKPRGVIRVSQESVEVDTPSKQRLLGIHALTSCRAASFAGA
jgi:hypothetical protein